MQPESSIKGLRRHHYARDEERPMKASSRRSTELRSAEELRHARESRYSRDREMLCVRLSSCTKEPNEIQLQITALERVKQELENRLCDYDERAHELRNRLSGLTGGEDNESRESLLHQRLVVEHRLTTTRDELTEVSKELERLTCYLRSQEIDARGSAPTPSFASRNSANLDLFFRSSATKRPLRSSSRPYSMDYVHGTSTARSRKPNSVPPHLRSHSLAEDYTLRRLSGKGSKRSSIPESGTQARQSCPTSSQVLLAVDEFNNSFSSRVIDPSTSRPRSPSCLRPLQIPSQERRNLFASYSRRSSTDTREFGNAIFLPPAAARSTAELLEELPTAPLPSYVHTLMSEFEQVSHPPLSLSFTRDKSPVTPVARKQATLSTVLEECSPISSVKSKASPKITGRNLLRKQRPIFTLRLPSHPSSQTSLFASSSTSIDASSEEQPLPVPFTDSPAPSRRKGLPSTRNHDLAMLGAAPDDIPEPPETPIPPGSKAGAVIKSKAARPMSVLRQVKSRLVQLGRH